MSQTKRIYIYILFPIHNNQQSGTSKEWESLESTHHMILFYFEENLDNVATIDQALKHNCQMKVVKKLVKETTHNTV